MDQPLEVTDFSGGITDNYYDCPQKQHQVMDNFLLEQYGELGKLFQRPGSQSISALAVSGTSTDTIRHLRFFNNKLFAQINTKLYAETSGVWAEIAGPTTAAFPLADTNTAITSSPWGRHLMLASNIYQYPAKLYPDDSGVYRLRTAGLPTMAGTTFTTTGGANNWLYKVVWACSYKVDATEKLEFLDIGGPQLLTTTAVASVTITTPTSLPSNQNWDYTNIKKRIYRTKTNGVDFYLLAELAIGAQIGAADTAIDSTLVTPYPYNDGSIENGPVPLCKTLHVMDQVCFYGNIKDATTSEIRTGRIYQSSPGDIDGVPPTFITDVQDAIVGISSYRSIPVVFCQNYVYRLEGQYDIYGRGGSDKILLSETVGCVSSESIVQTGHGIFWAGKDGIYYTNCYMVRRVTLDLVDRYSTLVINDTMKARIRSRYDKMRDRVYFSVCSANAGVNENNALWVLDLNFGLKDQVTITTWSGGNNFIPTAIEVDNDGIVYRSTKGYVFKHLLTLYSDPRVDTSTAYANWGKALVNYTFKSFATSFGDTFSRKYTTRVVLTARNLSPLSLQIVSNSDDGRKVDSLKPIRSRTSFVWGDADLMWGDHAYIWDYGGLIQEQRRFPSHALRCAFKQLYFQNAHIAIVSSDVLGNAYTDVVSGAFVILDNTKKFPPDPVGWFVSFAQDGYVREYEILTRSSDTQLLLDQSKGPIPASVGTEWVIRGSPKNEFCYILGYSIHWQALGRTQDSFKASGTGEVGT